MRCGERVAIDRRAATSRDLDKEDAAISGSVAQLDGTLSGRPRQRLAARRGQSAVDVATRALDQHAGYGERARLAHGHTHPVRVVGDVQCVALRLIEG